MRHNMMMDKLLQCPSDDGGVGWGVPSTFRGKRAGKAAALFLQSSLSLSVSPCLGDIIKPYSFLLASASMSWLKLNAQWWITCVMNSIRPATSEAVGDIEFLLTCKCFSSSGLRFLLTDSKYGHAYFNGLLKPIFYDMVETVFCIQTCLNMLKSHWLLSICLFLSFICGLKSEQSTCIRIKLFK